ncbi:hypothetical protein Tco_0220816, partial [Tanacetum coccineum]
TMYSASVEDLDTTPCFFDCQDMILVPRRMQYPEMDFLKNEQLAQSLSQPPCEVFWVPSETGLRTRLQRICLA